MERKSFNTILISDVNSNISYLCELGTSVESISMYIDWTYDNKDQVVCKPSAAGLVIRTTSSGVRFDLLHDNTSSKISNYAHPHPWLLTIKTHELEGITVQTW